MEMARVALQHTLFPLVHSKMQERKEREERQAETMQKMHQETTSAMKTMVEIQTQTMGHIAASVAAQTRAADALVALAGVVSELQKLRSEAASGSK